MYRNALAAVKIHLKQRKQKENIRSVAINYVVDGI